MMYKVDHILEAGNGKMAFVLKILKMFSVEVDDKMSKIKEALHQKNYKVIEDNMHQLKSNLRLLGREDLAEMAFTLEKKAHDQNCDQQCFEYLNTLMDKMIDLKVKIQKDITDGKYK